MYKIEKRKGGVALTFGGTVDKEDVDRWFKESEYWRRLAAHSE